jgi:hypothetical protein
VHQDVLLRTRPVVRSTGTSAQKSIKPG